MTEMFQRLFSKKKKKCKKVIGTQKYNRKFCKNRKKKLNCDKHGKQNL